MREEHVALVERAIRAAGRGGVTDQALGTQVYQLPSRQVLEARRELTRRGVLLPIRPPSGVRPVGWRHRDHATEAERAEADRPPAEPPSLFGES